MTHSRYSTTLDVRSLLRLIFITICGSSAVLFVAFTITHSEPHDFGVYYLSARAAISGANIYDGYGPYQLPYWYFPWLAWFYIPLGFFSFEVAYGIYITVSLLCAFAAITFLVGKFIPTADLPEKLFLFCMALVLCWLLFRVGQMDFILLGAVVLSIHLIDKGKAHLAGLLVPVLLFKPHLFIIFFPAALLKGGRKLLVSSSLSFLVIAAISFLIIPDWPQQMLRMLAESGGRTDNNWNFTTLPTLIGMQENWSGTANLPMTFGLVIIGLAVLWTFRALPTLPLLSLALAASLFCAPRAYSYNFPILIPAMVWVSSDLPKPLLLLFWFAAGALPFFFRFSTGSYWIVMAVLALTIFKAHKSLAGTRLRSETLHP